MERNIHADDQAAVQILDEGKLDEASRFLVSSARCCCCFSRAIVTFRSRAEIVKRATIREHRP